MKKRSLKINLTNQIMIATVLGIFWGVSFPGLGDQMQLVRDFFLRLIQMSVVVLVMGSVIEAVGGLDPKELGGIGGKVFLWFTGSTLVAAIFGLLFALILKPGAGLDQSLLQSTERSHLKLCSTEHYSSHGGAEYDPSDYFFALLWPCLELDQA